MFRRFALPAVAVALSLSGLGCSGPQRLTGSPPTAWGDDFAYQPLRRRSPSDVKIKTVGKPRPRPVRAEQRLPEHDATWEVSGRQRLWRWIVVHHSATHRGSAAIFDDHHRRRRHWDELGYHFVIGNGTVSGNGQVEVGSRWPKQKHGAHCKVGEDETYNEFGIGICLVGDFEKRRPTDAQMQSLARLVDYLAARYRIDDPYIIGHGDVDDTKCPGRHFPFEDLFRRLRRRRAARGALAARR